MQSSNTESFEAADPWILLALVHASASKPAATLSELIAACYSARQSIPLRSELEGGMRRLVAAGLIELHGQEIAPSFVARELWRECIAVVLWPQVAQAQLARRIGAPLFQVGTIPNEQAQQYVSDETYETAVAEHLASCLTR